MTLLIVIVVQFIELSKNINSNIEFMILVIEIYFVDQNTKLKKKFSLSELII